MTSAQALDPVLLSGVRSAAAGARIGYQIREHFTGKVTFNQGVFSCVFLTGKGEKKCGWHWAVSKKSVKIYDDFKTGLASCAMLQQRVLH